MDGEIEESYRGREASYIKHLILRRYLEKLVYKVGKFCTTFNYVEGFAGPWKSSNETLADTSPHIALAQLERAREGLARINRHVRMRALFVEKDIPAAAALANSLRNRSNASVIQGAFMERLPDVRRFIAESGKYDRAFTFLFVDPIGWTGYDPAELGPLLQNDNLEVVINFMSNAVVRFIDTASDNVRQTFVPLFGSAASWEAWKNTRGLDREEAIVTAFCRRLNGAGRFKHVVAAAVLNPQKNRTHFYLVYGTHDDEGLRTFRSIESDILATQIVVREKVRGERRLQRTGQPGLFPFEDAPFERYVQGLIQRYHERSRVAVFERLKTSASVPFDELEMLALQYPMTSTADLKRWLDAWKRQGLLQYEGLKPRERTLKHDSGHMVRWLGQSESAPPYTNL